MVYPLALMLMGGAALNKGRQDRQDDEDRRRRMAQEDEDRAARKMDREYMLQERQRAIDNRNALVAAAAPVAAQTVEQAGPMPDGSAMAPGFKVGDATFANQGEAGAAVVRENAPERRIARMARTLEQGGDFGGAQALRTGARQEQVADMQIRRSQQDEADEAFRRSLFDGLRKGGFGGLAEAMTASGADGMGGKAKFRAVTSADGKTVNLEQVGDKGEALGLVGSFPNSSEGALQAAFLLDRGTKPEAKLSHLRQQRLDLEARADKSRDFGLRASQEARLAANDGARLSMEQQRFALTKAVAEAEAKIPAAVKLQFGAYEKELTHIGTAIAKAQAEGQWDLKNQAAQELLTRQRVLQAKSEALVAPYLASAGGATPSDMFGIFSGAGSQPVGSSAPAATTSPARIAPARQAPAPMSARTERDIALRKHAAQEAAAAADPEIADLVRRAEVSGDARTKRALNIKINEIRARRYGL